MCIRDRGLVAAIDKGTEILELWYQLMIENIHYLGLKPDKWHKDSERQPQQDDVILFLQDDNPLGTTQLRWKLGIVTDASPRKITIRPASPKDTPSRDSTLTRSPSDVVILYGMEDLVLGSHQHQEAIAASC